jgi:DNA-binding LacI/PurR family transcriptional regulator
MPLKRITMADVARVAMVHQTTISLALRNDPRLPRATRLRLRTLAESLGYRPDPMLSALSFYRTSRDTAKTQPSMAFIMRSRTNLPAENFFAVEQFLKGARRAAERMGYRLVAFPIENTAGEGARLGRILKSRGIWGIIVGALDAGLRELSLDWDYFSGLCIESQHLGLSLHTVANNQSGSTRTAVRRLFELGYRRIGLAVGEIEETSLGKPFTAGYLVEVHEHRGLRSLPPLLLRSDDPAATAARLGAWVKGHKIDAVLGNWSNIPDLLRMAGLDIPRDVGVATLDYNPHRGAVAGIRQSHELVGERAVEALALLMKTNQRGLISLPNTTLVDGLWQDGADLPPKEKSLAKNAVLHRDGSRPNEAEGDNG